MKAINMNNMELKPGIKKALALIFVLIGAIAILCLHFIIVVPK